MALIIVNEDFIPARSKSQKRKLDELTDVNGEDTSISRKRPYLQPIAGGVLNVRFITSHVVV